MHLASSEYTAQSRMIRKHPLVSSLLSAPFSEFSRPQARGAGRVISRAQGQPLNSLSVLRLLLRVLLPLPHVVHSVSDLFCSTPYCLFLSFLSIFLFRLALVALWYCIAHCFTCELCRTISSLLPPLAFCCHSWQVALLFASLAVLVRLLLPLMFLALCGVLTFWPIQQRAYMRMYLYVMVDIFSGMSTSIRYNQIHEHIWYCTHVE